MLEKEAMGVVFAAVNEQVGTVFLKLRSNSEQASCSYCCPTCTGLVCFEYDLLRHLVEAL